MDGRNSDSNYIIWFVVLNSNYYTFFINFSENILRFIEMGIPVRMLELEGSPIHVDTPEDLERAQQIAKDFKE